MPLTSRIANHARHWTSPADGLVPGAAAWPHGPGDYAWHALARLRGTHRDPVVGSGPFARPAGVLSFAQAPDIILASRVQLTGAQT
ncbi:hypothetical protein [Streptomyces sp. NPDC060031]|uniref:hypothetical protein n=1 Tax=Streptomyces sp. NPDC060031 TaxID=3347043 RepID=UPI0036BC9B67